MGPISDFEPFSIMYARASVGSLLLVLFPQNRAGFVSFFVLFPREAAHDCLDLRLVRQSAARLH